ncbi:MAG TPA: hypothetical protein PLM06_13415 [Anaerolineae bacterium]|nr:hypothetical protein [Anaerolineae bacterium]
MKERFFTFLLLVGSIGAIVVGVLVGGRLNELSNETLSLAGGMLLGCAVGMVPVALIVAVGWFALKWHQASNHQPQAPSSQQPPIVIVAGGQALPYQPQMPSALPQAAEWQHSHEARQYTILGED